MLIKNPGSTAAAALSLALGIGATTAIFSLVNALLLRPMPFPDVERLVMVWETDKKTRQDLHSVLLLKFLDWQRHNSVFEKMTFFEPPRRQSLSDVDEATPATVARVSPEFFSVLGSAPLLGRMFAPEEAKEGGPPAVVLSQGIWKRRFGSDPAIIGKTITLDRRPRTVVGVMPAEFRFLQSTDCWVPFPMDTDSIAPVGPGTGRGEHGAWVFGKLKPGVTRRQAQAELETIASRNAAAYPERGEYRDRSVRMTSPHEHLVKNVRLLLYVFQAAALLVLLLATVNVANLLLARSESRGREMSLRAALGAGRRRIIRQLLTEGLLLAAIGGGGGLLVAFWGAASLATLAAGSLPRIDEVNLDWRVLAFACLVSLASGLTFGLAPALRATKTDLNECLKEGGAAHGLTGFGRSLMRQGLVIAEIGLSLMLLIGAGLFLKSFVLLNQVRLGFDPEHVLVTRVDRIGDVLRGPKGQELVDRLSSLPGVQAVGAVTHLPPTKGGRWDNVKVEGEPTQGVVLYQAMTPGYFRAMGISLLKGRGITERDVKGAPPVVVVNETFVNRYLGGADPIGKQLLHVGGHKRRTIVGMVRDVRNQTLLMETQPEVYFSSHQETFWANHLVLRTESDPMRLAAPVREVIRSALGEDYPISIQTMEERLVHSIMPQRFQTALVALFSTIGLILAAVGIYGVVSYSVAQRVREFGIRIAVGAQRLDILQLVVRRVLWLVIVGLGLGLIGAVVFTRVLRTFLFEVEPLDPLTFISVSVFLGCVALLASYIPARRAAKIDPMEALRYE
jgi:putative ABC transport system permease protein